MFIVFCIAALAIVAWVASISLLIKAGMEKGYSMDNKLLLWFVGLFASPIVLGLYVCSLPDARGVDTSAAANPDQAVSAAPASSTVFNAPAAPKPPAPPSTPEAPNDLPGL